MHSFYLFGYSSNVWQRDETAWVCAQQTLSHIVIRAGMGTTSLEVIWGLFFFLLKQGYKHVYLLALLSYIRVNSTDLFIYVWRDKETIGAHWWKWENNVDIKPSPTNIKFKKESQTGGMAHGVFTLAAEPDDPSSGLGTQMVKGRTNSFKLSFYLYMCTVTLECPIHRHIYMCMCMHAYRNQINKSKTSLIKVSQTIV